MDKETYTFEDRVYVNPETSLNEQLGFVDKLRSLQQEGTDKITRDTHNLGTDVTPNLGGLTGAEGMWQQQYVTPRVNTMLSNLRATAQAQALNDVLGNYQNQMKQRYNNAYRAARRRGGGGGGTGGGGGGNTGGDDIEGEIDWKATNTGGKKVKTVEPNYSPITGTHTYTFDVGGGFTQDVTVTYDKYGRPSKVDAGRNGTYTGEDAVTYYNRMRNNYKLKGE